MKNWVLVAIAIVLSISPIKSQAAGGTPDKKFYDTASAETIRRHEEYNAAQRVSIEIQDMVFWDTLERYGVLFLLILTLLWTFWHLAYQKQVTRYNQDILKLSVEAQAKLHNVRNNYTSFISLLDQHKYQQAHDYAENSAFYFSNALDIGSDEFWTIDRELDLMNAYYDAEKIFYGDVNILPLNLSDLEIKFILCPPEILTTLLHNSMKHAFKNNQADPTVSISMRRMKKLLIIEFADNGSSGNIGEFFARKNSGLNILLRRVRTLLLRAGLRREVKDCISIKSNINGVGTIIKIKLPYEVPA